jgi:DNA polymerase-3 subunit alpha
VKTGAFDYSGGVRKKLFDGIDAAMAGVAAKARDKAAGQHSFLDMFAEEPASPAPSSARGGKSEANGAKAPAVEDFAPAERLGFEKELLGFYVSGHPMNTYEALADALDTFLPDELLQQSDRTEFRLCGIASNIQKKLSKKDNRPWAAFVLATKKASVPLNMFADAYAAYSANLAENIPVVVLGNIIGGNDGARINVKECYPLENYVSGNVRKLAWLLQPTHPQLGEFLHELRTTVSSATGDTRIELGFLFEDRVASVAETSSALAWKLNSTTFQRLRAHPAVAGVQLETKRLELKQDRRWAKRG